MTKILSQSSLLPIISLLALLGFGLMAALPAGAQGGPSEGCTLVKAITIDSTNYAKDAVITSANADWGTICLVNTINSIVNWIFILLIVVAVGLIAVAGFLWMTSGGDPTKQGSAGKMIMAAIVGIIIAIFARIIPAVITGILV